MEDVRVYLNDKYNKNSKKIQEIIEFLENKGICFNFIKYDKSGENEIMDNDINFMNNYNDDNDEEDENFEGKIETEEKLIDNLNAFLLKEGLI